MLEHSTCCRQIEEKNVKMQIGTLYCAWERTVSAQYTQQFHSTDVPWTETTRALLAKVILFKEYLAQLAQTLLEWIIRESSLEISRSRKGTEDNESSIRNGGGHQLPADWNAFRDFAFWVKDSQIKAVPRQYLF